MQVPPVPLCRPAVLCGSSFVAAVDLIRCWQSWLVPSASCVDLKVFSMRLFVLFWCLPISSLANGIGQLPPCPAESDAGADRTWDGWELAKSIPAAEAHQAAAADERFLFAVSSTQIAKYERGTGQRVAVSTGPAKHLNSGFFWNNKLLCAHSNYPAVPEISEIKVLDPQAMTLSTFHHFHDYGGSLTWVVRHRQRWWCNFALYGDRNAETFLACFDDDWKELQRWTYPPQVIAQLGNYSLSGGLWRNDALLTTDHDHGRLYRLKLPASGSVLQFDGVTAVPFTGQGFAADPLTGGLIGIHRGRRQLLLIRPSD